MGILSFGADPFAKAASLPAHNARSVAVATFEPTGPSCILGSRDGFGVADGKGTDLSLNQVSSSH